MYQCEKSFHATLPQNQGFTSKMVQLKSLKPKTPAKSVWADAMRITVAVARRANTSEEDFLQAVIEELQPLKLRGMFLLMQKDGQLEVKASHLRLSKVVRKVSGTEILGFRFDPHQVDIFHQVLSKQEAVFTKDRVQILEQLLPEMYLSMMMKGVKLLGKDPVIFAPLSVRGRILGVMDVSAEWLTEEDVPMMAALADHIAISLDHLRTTAEMRKAIEREQLGVQVAGIATSSQELPEVFEQIFHLIANATGADAGAIALIDPGAETLSFKYLYGLPESLKYKPIPRGQGLTWQLIENRTPMFLPDYDKRPDALPAWVEAGVHAVIAAPLITSHEVIGAIGLFLLSPQKAFSEEHLKRIVDVSRVAAGVIHNAHLYEEATRHAEEADALRRGSIAISSSLDYETVLAQITERAKALLEADGSRVHLLDPESGMLECVIALHQHAEEVMQFRLQPGEGFAGFVLQKGEPLLVNNPTKHPSYVQVPGTPEDEPEVLAIAPLKVRHRTMGVMTVQREGYERPFTYADLNLLTAFASQAAVAIENAHLYGQIEAQAKYLEDEVETRTKELAISEARYRSLVETSLAGIYQVDAEARITYVNKQLAELLERSQEEIIGRSVVDFLLPEHRERIFNQVRGRMRGDEPTTEMFEIDLLSWSGRHIPVILTAVLIFDEQGKTRSITGLVLDITTQKNLEAALRTERDRLKIILSNVGDAVVVTDPGGVIEFINPAWEHLNGYDVNEALGKNASLVKSGEADSEFYFQMWDTILAGRVWRGEIVNRRKDGSTYEAVLTITPVLNEKGSIVNFVGVQHDISMLKELDRLKSQFVSDVSHELRTPLTNIRLYLDLLSQTEYDQRAEKYMETLSRESERLSSLIEDLLSLSRLEADTIPLTKEPVAINRILGALAEDRERLARQYGLELRLECEAELPFVMGDALLLGQLFTNLLTNALSYTPDGGKILLKTRSQSSAETTWVLVEVSDTGIGIPPMEHSLIFRRFFRGKGSRPASIPGTGLGLAICKEIAERHGGKIMVESEGIPGKGSRFTVWLPGD
jgi:PAS domain S-box-containing protein